MTAYAIALVNVKDPSWIEEYGKVVGPLVASHGGKYIVQDASANVLEGDINPNVVVVLEFPDMDTAKGWYECDEYRPHLEARLAGSDSRFFLVNSL